VESETLGPNPAGPWHVLPWLRPGTFDGAVCEPLESLNDALAALPLKRVPIAFGIDAAEPENYQHGTELWKYMTQNTLRLS
jgi:hypothetical protein